MEPLGEKGRLEQRAPSGESVQETNAKLNIHASPREHTPPLKPTTISNVNIYDDLFSSQDNAILEKEIQKNLSKRSKKSLWDTISGPFSFVLNQGVDLGKKILGWTDAPQAAGHVLGAGLAVVNIVENVQKIFNSWDKWLEVSEIAEELKTSTPIDYQQKLDFFKDLNALLSNPKVTQEEVLHFFQQQGIPIKPESPSGFAKFRKEVLTNKDAQDRLWTLLKIKMADDYLSKLPPDRLKTGLKKLGISIPDGLTLADIKKDRILFSRIMTEVSYQNSRVVTMEKMLSQRKRVEEEKSERLEPKFRETLRGIEEELESLPNFRDRQIKFENILGRLYDLGLREALADIETSEELLSKIRDPEFSKGLLKAHVKHQDTLSALARNGLKAMSAAKMNREKKLYRYELAETTILSTFAIISSIVTVIGAVLTLTGVGTLPGIVALTLGAIGTGLSISSMATGNLYAFFTSPNRLKESLFHGEGIKATLSKLPYKYYKYYYDKALLKKERNQLAISAISAKISGKLSDEQLEIIKPSLNDTTYRLLKKPPSDEALLTELAKQRSRIAELDRRIDEAFEKFNDSKEQNEYHENALVKAGLKDFAIKSPAADLLFPETGPGILGALEDIDEMTKDALKHYVGVDVDKLPEKVRYERKNAEELLKKDMMDFYGGTIDEALGCLLKE